MMPDDADRELRAHFARLRAEEAESSGVFRVPHRARAGRPESRRRNYRLPATLAAAAAIVVVALSLADRASRPPRDDVNQPVAPFPSQVRDAPFASGDLGRIPLQLAWRTPTDVLLETPGRELLRDLPRLGVSSFGNFDAPSPAPEPPPRKRPHPDSATPRSAISRSST